MSDAQSSRLTSRPAMNRSPSVLARPWPSALAALTLVLLAACSKPEVPADPVPFVKTVTVQAGQGAMGTQFSAEVKARVESPLGFRVGGQVLRRHVELGAVVRKGQVLVSLDPRDVQLASQAAQAALSNAEVQLNLAQSDLKRFKDLRDQNFISAAEFERRDAAARSAIAQAEQARAQASVQRNQAGYASLTADADGVVTAVMAEPGQVVAAGTPVIRLAQQGPRDVVFQVPEDAVQAMRERLKQSPEVQVRFWARPGEAVPAKLREVSASADAATRTYQAKAELPASSSAQLGQTATVLMKGDAMAVIKLPSTAVFEREGRSQVWVLDKAAGKVRAQPVVVAGADGTDLLVAQGVKPGDVVVSAGTHVLQPGQAVKLYQAPQAAASQAPKSL